MKTFICSCFIFSLIAFFNAGCGKNEDAEAGRNFVAKAKVGHTVSGSNKNKNAEKEEIKADTTEIEKVNPIDSKELEKYLPKAIQGTEKLASNCGKKTLDDKKYTYATSEYIFAKGGIIITINDFGYKNNIPKAEFDKFDKMPTEHGKTSKKISKVNSKGYLIWDNDTKSGYISLLHSDRFIVKIEGVNIPENTVSLEEILSYIKINDLKKDNIVELNQKGE